MSLASHSITACQSRKGFLSVSGGHEIFWRMTGPADAPCCLVIHGGPGAGSNARVLELFQTEKVRIVQIDQRGSGRSLPIGSLVANTTADLLDDMEDVRRHLGIDRWYLFAGSWGTTLALLYAAAHPTRCTGLILRGITEWTADKADWAIHHRRFLAPAAHRYLTDPLSEAERCDIIDAYHRRILSGDEEAAKRWHLYEKHFLRPVPLRPVDDETGLAPDFLTRARIHVHYFRHQAFLTPGQMEIAISRLPKIPARIVHGSLDLLCPPLFADRLARQMPDARLTIVPGGGHAFDDPLILPILKEAIAQAGLA